MLKNSEKFELKYVMFSIIIFFVMIAQGGYFKIQLIALNLFFLIFIMVSKKKFKCNWTMMLFTVLFFIMVTSGLFFSISPYIALSELIKYSLYPLSYFVFLNLDNTQKLESIFFKSIVLLMIFGMLGFVGLSPIANMVTQKGNRLQSFLQYANTTAVFMGIGTFYSTEFYIKSKKITYILMSVLFFVALILTNSRISFALFLPIYSIYLIKFTSKKIKRIFIVTIVIIVCLLVIFNSRIIRISLFEPTLVERYITYMDATNILKTHIYGLGVGNWQFMQFLYQSAPYQVRQIHNIYLQIALDGSVLSLIVWLIILSINFIKSYKQKNIYFYIGLFIVSSSFFEVHFNFGIFIIFFTYVLVKINESISFNKSVLVNNFKYLLGIPTVLLLVFMISEYNISSGELEQKNQQYNNAYASYIRALKFNPYNYEIYFKLASLERNPDKAFEFLETSYTVNSWDNYVLIALAEGYLHKKDFEKSYFYASHLFEVFPYSVLNQELVKTVLNKSYEDGLITKIQYKLLLDKLQLAIATKNENINKNYYYIESDMRY